MAEIELSPLGAQVASIQVCGEYDVADWPQVRKAVRTALKSDADGIVLDLSQCRFIDTAALRCVATTNTEAANVGKAFAVIDSRLQVERFLRILEIDEGVSIVATVEEALEELGSSRLVGASSP